MQITRKEFFSMAAGAAAASMTAPALALGAESSGATGEGDAPCTTRSNSKPTTGITQAVIHFISDAGMGNFPPDVVRQGKRCMIDGLGVMLAGTTMPGSKIVNRYVTSQEGAVMATVLGPKRLKAPTELAALANGASGHAMDYDDTQLSNDPTRAFGLLTHPTTPVLAASLAVAEKVGATGAQMLEAFLVGFEVECKIAEAINPDHYLRGFHSTGTIGVFGAAAAAAKLMKLEAEALANTLAIAASLSAGIRVNFGTMTKPLHAGRAAQNGVFAASLASAGFTGGADGLDGQWGFFQVAGGGAESNRILGALGKPYSIVNPGVSVKPYPCGSLSHPSMDAMLKIVKDNDIKPDQVKLIRVRAGNNILGPLRYKTAHTDLEAKFCLPFLMSVLVLRRRAGIREFTDQYVNSAPVQEMMKKVDVQFDPKIEAQGYQKMRSVIEVYLNDGRSFTQAADTYRGGPDNPFTQQELRDKFTDCASLLLSAATIRRALDMIESVEQLKDARELAQVLALSDATESAKA